MQELKVRTCHSPGSDRLGGCGVGVEGGQRLIGGGLLEQLQLSVDSTQNVPVVGLIKFVEPIKVFIFLFLFFFLF